MKQKTKSIVTALLLGVLCAVTLSAVITVPDWETARADLLIGMQYETTGLDFDAVPGWLAALVMLHQNFPLDGWAWGPAAAGLAVLLCWVRGQREAKPKRTELVLSIVFGIAEVLGLSICKLGSWAFVFKNPYQLCVGCAVRGNIGDNYRTYRHAGCDTFYRVVIGTRDQTPVPLLGQASGPGVPQNK